MLDVLIQTYNEELNLPHTLKSLDGWVHRIVVVDSGSTDRTVEIAKAAGADVVHHAFQGYAAQKNWALDNLNWESPWILILDADEAVSPGLRDEIVRIVSRPPEQVPESAFLLNRVLVFLGKQIWHCGYFPSWNLRLFRRGTARYEERLVHEHMTATGKVGRLKNLLIHQDRRGLEHFIAKHNRYSTLEAREMLFAAAPWPGMRTFLRNRVARVWFLKVRVLPHLPLPWLWRFVYMFIFRLGVLDGPAGWVLCSLISTYQMFIATKYREMRRLSSLPHQTGSTLRQPEGAMPDLDALAPYSSAPTADAPFTPFTPQAMPSPIPADELVPSADSNGQPAAAAAAAATATVPARVTIAPAFAVAGRAPVSVIIPTLNEEANLARCLDHLQWADEIVIVDSGSKDKTRQIAEAYGAKVVEFRWNGEWPKKKNWTLRHAPLKHEWVLIVDADEWITPPLADEISRAVRSDKAVGYYVNRRFIFMGRWIKHCGYYPSWNLRLLKRGTGEYERLTGIGNTGSGDNEVHEHIVVNGPAEYLQEDMLHFAFPTIHTFMEKHNRYSNWEAAVQYQGFKEDTAAVSTNKDLSHRRKLKLLSRKLPLRPMLRFCYSYFWKRGFLDGKPGYVFCRLLAIYEYLSVAKFYELTRAEADIRAARRLSDVPSVHPQLADDAAVAGPGGGAAAAVVREKLGATAAATT